ncbi:MAG: DUF1294 domain-containing protein [Lachnospiraceae bacterium]|nr:DUF1294 domain-containing protein [Lachnospiraceae bacterium]
MADNYIRILGIVMAFLVFFCLADIISFALFALDKKRTVLGMPHIPAVLLLLSSVLGGIGGLIGMWTCEERSGKRIFRIWVGLFAFLQVLLILYVIVGYVLLLLEVGGWLMDVFAKAVKVIMDSAVGDLQ